MREFLLSCVVHCGVIPKGTQLRDHLLDVYELEKEKLKVSATLQDRPRADRCSVSCFYKNPYKPYIF